MSSRPRLISVVLILSFALVGCSGDSDPVSVATSVDTSLAPVSTSVPVPDSTVTTTAVPEPTVPVTATATAPASSAPTSAPLSDEEQVIAAYEAAYDAFWAASQDPDNPELRRQLSRATTPVRASDW